MDFLAKYLVTKMESEGLICQLAEAYILDPNHATDLEYVLSRANIECFYKDLQFDVLGNPICGVSRTQGGRKIIIISTQITNPQRKRFTIAHEIGHVLLGHEPRTCTESMLYIFNDRNTKEREANTFAAELLLPKIGVERYLAIGDPTLTIAERMADRYSTSVLSAAIRMVKKSKLSVALIKHNGVKTDWIIQSDSCIFKVNAGVIDERSIAYGLSDNRPSGLGEVDPAAWTEGNDDLKCREHSKIYSGYCLTLLNLFEE